MRLAAGDSVPLTDQEYEGGNYCWTELARRRVIDTIPIALEDQDPDAIVVRYVRTIRPETKVTSVSRVISATGYGVSDRRRSVT